MKTVISTSLPGELGTGRVMAARADELDKLKGEEKVGTLKKGFAMMEVRRAHPALPPLTHPSAPLPRGEHALKRGCFPQPFSHSPLARVMQDAGMAQRLGDEEWDGHRDRNVHRRQTSGQTVRGDIPVARSQQQAEYGRLKEVRVRW